MCQTGCTPRVVGEASSEAWWGYLHSSGRIHIKRWFQHQMLCDRCHALQEHKDAKHLGLSPLLVYVFPDVIQCTHEEAYEHFSAILKANRDRDRFEDLLDE